MSDKLKFPVKVKKESRKKRDRAKKRAERRRWKLENGDSVRLYDFTPWFASSVLLAYAGIFAIDVYFIVAVEKSRIAAIVVGAVFLASLLAVIWYFIVNCAVLDETGVRRGRFWIAKEEAYWFSEYHERFKEEKIYIRSRGIDYDKLPKRHGTAEIVFQCLSHYPAALEYVLGEAAEAPRKPFIRGKR